MNVNTIIQLALQGLQAILSLIGEIKGQAGLTDDQILAQAEAQTSTNSQLYQTLMAGLQSAPPPPPTTPSPAPSVKSPTK